MSDTDFDKPFQTPQYSESKYRILSLGVVVANNDNESPTIQVKPLEMLGFSDGEIKTDMVSKTVEFETYRQQSRVAAETRAKSNATLQSAPYLTAKWHPIGRSQRITPPSVAKGERVLIFQFENAPEYYWETVGNDHTYRKQERVVYIVKADTDYGEGADEQNSYRLEIDSRNMAIKLTTSKKINEFCTWKLDMNLVKGVFSIENGMKDVLKWDADKVKFSFENRDGSKIEVEKKKILIDAKEEIKFNGAKETIINTDKLTANVKGPVNVKATDKITLDAPKTVIQGKLQVTGETTVADLKANSLECGSATFSGMVTFNGGVSGIDTGGGGGFA